MYQLSVEFSIQNTAFIYQITRNMFYTKNCRVYGTNQYDGMLQHFVLKHAHRNAKKRKRKKNLYF